VQQVRGGRADSMGVCVAPDGCNASAPMATDGNSTDGWLQALFELSVFGYKIRFLGVETLEACHTKFPIVATM
jgi:hypothetical protein